MADSFDQFENLLREHIHGRVFDMTLDTDDPIWPMMQSFEPISIGGRTADGAAGYEASYRIKIQNAGLTKAGSFTGNTIQQMGTGNILSTGQSADSLYPDPRTAPLRSYQSIKLLLKRIQGVLALNTQQIMADLAANPLENVAGDFMADAVELVRRRITTEAYGSGNGTVARSDGAFTVGEVGGSGLAEVLIKEGRPLRFIKGQRYVFGSNETDESATNRTGRAGNINSPGIARCVDINTKDRKVSFESEPGEGDLAVSDGDHIILHGSLDFSASDVDAGSLAANGIEALLIDSGTYPGTSLDVATHQHLRSHVSGDDTARVDPTMEVMADIVDDITDAGLIPPTQWIAEQSVWSRWAQLERQTQSMVTIPQGQTFTAAGGSRGPVLGHGDYAFERLTSQIVRANAIYGLTPSTLMKFVPLGDRTIRWAHARGGEAGASSIFTARYVGTQLSELKGAEFDVAVEFGCIAPKRHFRRIGLQSKRTI